MIENLVVFMLSGMKNLLRVKNVVNFFDLKFIWTLGIQLFSVSISLYNIPVIDLKDCFIYFYLFYTLVLSLWDRVITW